MEPVFVRALYNYDMDAASFESGLECKDPSMAQQQFLEESDINNIVERFGLNGQLPENPRMPQYGDFTQVGDFQSAMNAVIQAQSEFMQLPGKLRARFDHDPQQLLEFLANADNRVEAQSLGLLKAVEASPPPVVAPVAPLQPV